MRDFAAAEFAHDVAGQFDGEAEIVESVNVPLRPRGLGG